MLFRKKVEFPTPATALKGRPTPIPTATTHFLNGRPLKGPYPDGIELAMFGLGCFWGAERKFWELDDGIWITAVGYAAGITPNPTYEEVCSGQTGHNEVVRVVHDPAVIWPNMLKPSASSRRNSSHVAHFGTSSELAINTRGALSCVRNTPTGLPDWTSSVSSSRNRSSVRTMSRSAWCERAARPEPP